MEEDEAVVVVAAATAATDISNLSGLIIYVTLPVNMYASHTTIPSSLEEEEEGGIAGASRGSSVAIMGNFRMPMRVCVLTQ